MCVCRDEVHGKTGGQHAEGRRLAPPPHLVQGGQPDAKQPAHGGQEAAAKDGGAGEQLALVGHLPAQWGQGRQGGRAGRAEFGLQVQRCEGQLAGN